MPKEPISINDIFVVHLINDMTMLDGAGTDNEGQPLIKLRDAQKAIIKRRNEYKMNEYPAKSIILKIPGIRKITLNFWLSCFFFGLLSLIGIFVVAHCLDTIMAVSNVEYFELIPVIAYGLLIATLLAILLTGFAAIKWLEENS